MTYPDFLQHLKKEKFTPCYFIHGTEEYLIEDCTRRLLAKIIDPATRDFNLDVYYASEVDAGKIIETANAYPMLAESRVVVVKDIHKLSASNLEVLAGYVEKPSITTRLILTSDKKDLRTKVYTRIKSGSTQIEVKSLYDNQVPDWIRNFLSVKGYSISQQASLLLQARVGNNLRGLTNELEKILLNLNGRKKIEEADVQGVVGMSRSFSVFNLTDAVGNRDLNKAITILRQMLENGESPTGIVAMLTRHFSNLLKIKSGSRLNKSQTELTAMTGLPPFLLRKATAMSRNYSDEQMARIFENLLEADYTLKSSGLAPDIALQTLLIRIINSN